MSFESPDNEKNFPGLYRGGSFSDLGSGDEEPERGKRKELGKKKDGKKDKKEKGYKMFEEEESEEELGEDVKSPSKVKKAKPGFKFPARKDIFTKVTREKEEKKDKDAKKEEKEKKKEEKEGKKFKVKDKKKPKHHDVPTIVTPSVYESPIFGVPLALAVERNKSHDGIELPAIVRECIDHIEDHGLDCEGIYRISGVKSKVQQLKDCYQRGLPACLEEHEPNVVASLLKQFLRELPEPVLTTLGMVKFEEASVLKSERRKVETFYNLIQDLPPCNCLLLSWMIVHMTHIIQHQRENKMTLQNVSIVLSPTMQISHRVLNILFSHSQDLFHQTVIKRYVPPLKPATSRWSLELPDSPAALEEELAKQESLLSQLHAELNAGVKDELKEEQLWEVQRVVTQLKRKIKFAKKTVEVAEKRRKDLEQKKSSASQISEEEELKLDLQEMPEEAEPSPRSSESAEADTTSRHVEDEPETDTTSRHVDDEPETDKADEDPKEEPVQHTEAASSADDSEPRQPAAKPQTETETAPPPQAEPEESVTSSKTHSPAASLDREKKSKGADETSPVDKTALEESSSADNPSSPEEVPGSEGSKEKKKGLAPPAPREKQEEKAEAAETTVSPKGPLQPHMYLSHEPLQPIKAASPMRPAREAEMVEERRTNPTLRELEEELLGKKKKSEEIVEDEVYDEEMQKLLEEEYYLKLEEEELQANNDELRKKIETEESETERLRQEIAEIQYLRQDSDLEDMSDSSDSSYESEDEDELQEMLQHVIADNEKLEHQTTEMCQKIHEERMVCLSVKLQIRMLQQQQQLESSQSSMGAVDR